MAKPKAIFRYVNEETRKKFKNSCALLTISVGQQTHEGEVFKATMELVNNSFGSCVILVDDSLQRHTMALNETNDADFFYDLSIKEGQRWLERNKRFYDLLNIPRQIMHWNKWLNHPNFVHSQNEIIKLIDADPAYRTAFDESINEFLDKYCSRLACPENFDRERAYKLSLDFVIEECSALCLWPELKCHFEVYPNSHNMAIEETRKRFVAKLFPDLLQPITIGFRNANQLKPQSFSLEEEELEQQACVN